MAVCYLGCDELLVHQIREFPAFAEMEVCKIDFPITGCGAQIDLLIVGPEIQNLDRLAATISDWNLPPATLFVIPEPHHDEEAEMLHHHPRVGRSIFFCTDKLEDFRTGLESIHTFKEKQISLPIDHSLSGNYNTNNISPRWLFQTLMENLDQYIYFKDKDSRFLAVSRYLATRSGRKEPSEVLGLTDFELFDTKHSEEAYADERAIATGEIERIDKEESVQIDGSLFWVSSRKLPFRTRSNYLAGCFGLSRDITKQKELQQELEKKNERMQSELKLARNLQSTLLQASIPDFTDEIGNPTLEIATKYIPSFHLSGDFFSINQTASGGAAILIADVMGHGVRAAMVTAMIQIAVTQLQPCANQPAAFMSQLNKIIKKTMQPSDQVMFATAAYCYIDLKTNELTYAQGGANHGVYVPKEVGKNATAFKRNSANPALGLIPDVQYTEEKIQLFKGDELVFYTDGIVEAAMGDEEYSEARMIDFLMDHRREAPSEMLEALINSVHEFTQNDELEDDVCLIGIRIC